MYDYLDYPIIGGLLETLNWLTITTPFFAGFTIFNWGESEGEGNLARLFLGVLGFLGLVAIWYFLYQYIKFPFWMGWFSK